MILEKIEELLKEVSVVSAKNAEDVEQLRLKYLSKKGEINALMGEFRNVAADQKKVVGMKINELKQLAQNKINDLREQLESCEAQSNDIDLTRTAYPVELGTRHPLSLVKKEIIDIYSSDLLCEENVLYIVGTHLFVEEDIWSSKIIKVDLYNDKIEEKIYEKDMEYEKVILFENQLYCLGRSTKGRKSTIDIVDKKSLEKLGSFSFQQDILNINVGLFNWFLVSNYIS